MSPLFTLEEANRALPWVVSTLARTTQLWTGYRAAIRPLLLTGRMEPGGDPPKPTSLPPNLAEPAARAHALLTLVGHEGVRLGRSGLIVRDLERGHVDFPTVLDGEREVVLCWALGDPSVSHFHEIDGDLPSRQPVGEHRFFRLRQLGA